MNEFEFVTDLRGRVERGEGVALEDVEQLLDICNARESREIHKVSSLEYQRDMLVNLLAGQQRGLVHNAAQITDLQRDCTRHETEARDARAALKELSEKARRADPPPSKTLGMAEAEHATNRDEDPPMLGSGFDAMLDYFFAQTEPELIPVIVDMVLRAAPISVHEKAIGVFQNLAAEERTEIVKRWLEP